MRCRHQLPTVRACLGAPPTRQDVPGLVELTCVTDGFAHLVTEQELVAGAERGRYSAVCGRVVVPAPMVAPDGARCPGCAGR